MHGMRTANGRRCRFGQPVSPDLALGDQLSESADGVLDGNVRVHPVLVVEVNVIGLESLERTLHRRANVCWAAIELTLIGFVVQRAELCRNDRPIETPLA